MASAKQKKHIPFKADKARVIFFDLEYYVPKQNRKSHGFSYNPAVEENKLLGGIFYSFKPGSDLTPTSKVIAKKMKAFWLWDYKSEQHLLQSVYAYLKNVELQVYTHFQGSVSPVLCGIGITNSDIPVLCHLLNKHNVDLPQKIFEFQNHFRVLDLSQLSIGVFNNADQFLYPKTKNEILGKFLKGKTMEDGRSVWRLYELQEFEKITDRVIEEVLSTVACYKAIKDTYDLFKQLEVKHKKESRNIARQATSKTGEKYYLVVNVQG